MNRRQFTVVSGIILAAFVAGCASTSGERVSSTTASGASATTEKGGECCKTSGTCSDSKSAADAKTCPVTGSKQN
ncbi:MAG: hypothetical protein JNM07_02990 [Phycisphaerae bacterium]|nr:hypothetical protein [Phycisphaerae bacterium]